MSCNVMKGMSQSSTDSQGFLHHQYLLAQASLGKTLICSPFHHYRFYY